MKKTVIINVCSLEDPSFYVRGGIDLSGNKIKAKRELAKDYKNGRSAYIAYNIPEEYHGKAYVVDVDHINKSSSAGVIIGAKSRVKVEDPEYFLGYSCSLTEDGGGIFMGIFDAYGWRKGLVRSPVKLGDRESLHYRVTVQGKAMTFEVYPYGQSRYGIDAPLFETRYEIGSDREDIHNAFVPTVGLRQYYNDKGYFENFTVSVLDDDAIPQLTEDALVGNTAFRVSGLEVAENKVSGIGAMLSKEALCGNYRISLKLASKNTSRVYFGMKDEKNGYAFEINSFKSTVYLYKIEEGVYKWLGEKKNIIREKATAVNIDVHDGIVSCFYDNYFENGEEFPKFEFALEGTDGKTGVWLEGGSVEALSVSESRIVLPDVTYTNPINPGADPDCLFYEGTYYLYVYNTSHNGKEVFRVFTSKDLAHFTPGPVIFEWRDEYSETAMGGTSFSPNVSYYNGLFYLFFAAVRNDGSGCRSVFYATSKSPLGPFVHDGPLVPVNAPERIRHEIDGHPFYDDDGRIYMSFSRSTVNGSVWLEEVEFRDGVVIPKPETDTCVLMPDKSYETDGSWLLCEGGYIRKHKGYYYMIYATCCYARHYGEAYAISKNPLGPYEKYEYNPILTYNYTLNGPGDALIVPSPDGKELYMIYHRHHSLTQVDQRNTCVDLIKFVPDPDGGPDILTVRGPSCTPQKMPSHE